MKLADISQRSSQGVENPEKQSYPAYELSIPFFLDIFQLVGNIIPDTRKHYLQRLGIMFPVPGTVLYFADFSIGQLSSVGLMSSICSWTAPRLKTLSSMV